MIFTIQEYGSGIPVTEILSYFLDLVSLELAISKANRLISSKVNERESFIYIRNGYLKCKKIVGIFKLSKNVYLEVYPKFVTTDDDTWRENFFLLSILSRYGSILEKAEIPYGKDNTDLFDICAQIFVNSYLRVYRKAVHSYNNLNIKDFDLIGDFEAEDLVLYDEDGFPQRITVFDNRNELNAVLSKAAQLLIKRVNIKSLRNKLNWICKTLGKQNEPRMTSPKLNGRYKDWQDIYNLSYSIILGSNYGYGNKQALATGFVVQTWRVWEWIISYSIKFTFPRIPVYIQRSVFWGERIFNDKIKDEFVRPDVIIRATPDYSGYLLDAKYKYLSISENFGVKRDDLYEAYAFCGATSTSNIALIYPKESASNNEPPICNFLYSYKISTIRIIILQLSLGSLSDNWLKKVGTEIYSKLSVVEN